MNTQNWNTAAYQLSQQGQSYVLITLVGVTGSTPRDSGTKMVITANEYFDTIGGGHLEHVAIKYAHSMLKNGLSTRKNEQHIQHFQLGSNLGQCCGGTASVLFESFIAESVNIMLFGAGHVGQALLPILSSLPCHITWVDSRADQFPAHAAQYSNTSIVVSESPEDEVAAMPANSYFIVMTHNHQIDFDISQAILKRGDFKYLGLIASDTKWRRFKQRYKHRDIDEVNVNRMHCPIGLEQVQGKRPMEVAVSVAGQIINIYQTDNAASKSAIQKNEKGSQQGVSLTSITHLLTEKV